jgi:hypothetical protein
MNQGSTTRLQECKIWPQNRTNYFQLKTCNKIYFKNVLYGAGVLSMCAWFTNMKGQSMITPQDIGMIKDEFGNWYGKDDIPARVGNRIICWKPTQELVDQAIAEYEGQMRDKLEEAAKRYIEASEASTAACKAQQLAQMAVKDLRKKAQECARVEYDVRQAYREELFKFKESFPELNIDNPLAD